jgi:hypothetical protein
MPFFYEKHDQTIMGFISLNPSSALSGTFSHKGRRRFYPIQTNVNFSDFDKHLPILKCPIREGHPLLYFSALILIFKILTTLAGIRLT